MILTEDKTYTMSLELEDGESTTGLSSRNVELEFSNKELLHAVITCGIPVQRMTAAFLSKKNLELLYKLFLTETALDTEGDRLKKTQRTAYLDSSEKSVMSYYLGMFFTKLIGRRLNGMDYMTHLNLIRRPDGKGYIDFFHNEWRPEMIGYSSETGAWSIWEAKGGSNRREQALKKGSQQAAAIATVNGSAPDPAAVCMTYYDHSYLCAVIRHPEKIELKKRENVLFREEDFFRAYYRPICELFLEKGAGLVLSGENAELTLSLPVFPEADDRENSGEAAQAGMERPLRVGMPKKLFYCLMDGDYAALAANRAALLDVPAPEGAFAGADGIYVR